MPTKKAAGTKKGASKKKGPGVRGTCFVVMGFGKKVDFETGRTLDLDKAYEYIIKPGVAAAGFDCVRADEIVHSGLIDVPMYEQLLNADVVVADLSTSNKNAYYELGVRHALKPYTTIVICEDGIKTFPFDVNHVAVRQYRHMGDGIDFGEVKRFRSVLKKAIVEISNRKPPANDSPVYTLIDNLTPPALAKAIKAVARAVAESAPGADSAAGALSAGGQTHSELMQKVDKARQASDFMSAKTLLKIMRDRMSPNAHEYADVTQRLALATYKCQQPTRKKALEEARALLETLGPATERGFYLRNDHYNGINLAFMLNVRAANARSRAEAIADFVQAERIRREVIDICLRWLKSESPPVNEALKKKLDEKYMSEAKYWIMATLAGAYAGVGDEARARKWFSKAARAVPEKWMEETTQEQMNKLRALLADSPLKYVKEGRP